MASSLESLLAKMSEKFFKITHFFRGNSIWTAGQDKVENLIIISLVEKLISKMSNKFLKTTHFLVGLAIWTVGRDNLDGWTEHKLKSPFMPFWKMLITK